MINLSTVDYKDPNAYSVFGNSMRDTGFAIICNHDISYDLMDNVYEEWKMFFNMPDDYKSKFLFQREYGVVQDGFYPISISEKAKGYNHSDIKEFYHFSPDGRSLPDIIRYTNILYNDLLDLAVTLLTWLSRHIGGHYSIKQPLEEVVDRSCQTILRAIHYPPLPDSVEQHAMRAAPHEDINFITLLIAATEPGLEVQDKHKRWHQVSPKKHSIVVNAGDMLSEFTDGYYKSTTHRVINPQDSNHSRYSMPLFVHPMFDVKLSNRYTAKQYLDERLKELGLLSKT
ncbi:Isopenicillin N synthase family oxygenase [Candidatus Cyrtobacter comes]|uniref:2-oxoglutarate-dependent ethylene/succinate-forming enzyme n=1 Tax=Candidatus Cyrtobacter comes TaxID=675776 RepID=A0ABU5L6M0_9RICK|nr:2OG-Fe(II) oxygenase family protein [Candidatus Cyrtobacter comes]MDZ5761777.1 Isopenicillin N synthase family oxygenase [Candidatus Cyrtobacter comes]